MAISSSKTTYKPWNITNTHTTMKIHSSMMVRSSWWIAVSLLLLSWSSSSSSSFTHAQQQDPTTLNGGSVLAMAGKECVALAMDKRFGSGPQMVNIASRHVLTPKGGHLMVAFTGLEGDVQSLSQELSIQISSKLSRALGFMASRHHQSYKNPRQSQQQHHHHQIISPSAMAMLTSHVLYGRKQSPYFVEPLVVGLEKRIHPASPPATVVSPDSSTAQKNTHPEKEDDEEDHETEYPLCQDDNGTIEHTTTRFSHYHPFLCAQDCLGAQSRSEAFVCAGLASKSLYGTAEALWRPNLPKEDLARICGKAFLSALERDCLSGYGAMVYLITKDGIEEYDLACRND